MKNPFTYIGEIIDYFSKNIDRIKTIGTILLVMLFVMSIGGNGCQHNKALELANKIARLDFKNTILSQNIFKKDSLIGIKNYEIDSLSVVIDKLQHKTVKLEAKGSALQADLRHLKDSIHNMPVDSSYSFLQAKAYPHRGELKYPFNRKQVKDIHLDYLENKNLWGVTENLKLQVSNCKDILVVKDERTEKYRWQVDNLKLQKGNYEQIIKNKDKETELLEKEVKKEKRDKGVWKVVSGILAGLAILIAL